MANLIKGSLQKELNAFFKILNRSMFTHTFITKGAFTKARKKISHSAFIQLRDELSIYFSLNFQIKTWNNFRLIAVDGSTVKLPKEDKIIDHFGTQSHENLGGCPMARVSQSYDILNNLTLDASIAPIKIGEQNLMIEHIHKAPENSLFLLDRGYPAFWLFLLIGKYNHHFCARVKAKWSRQTIDFYNSGKKDAIVEIKPHHSANAQLRKLGLPKTTKKFRLIRIELDSSETEILITSLLDSAQYQHHLFQGLYFKRWGVEEDYKRLKHRIEIENFSGKSPESIYQDFHAKIFSKNLTFIIVNSTKKSILRKTKLRKHCYKVNFTYALAEMKHTMIRFFNAAHPEILIKRFQELIVENIEPIRKNRKFPRKGLKSRRKFYLGYKPTG